MSLGGSNGECIFRPLGGYDFHLLLVLQVKRCPFLTGQVQIIERHPCLSFRFQDELAASATSLQKQGEFMALIQALWYSYFLALEDRFLSYLSQSFFFTASSF